MKRQLRRRIIPLLLSGAMILQGVMAPVYGEQYDSDTVEQAAVQSNVLELPVEITAPYREGQLIVRYKDDYSTNGMAMAEVNSEIGAQVLETYESVSGLQLVELPEGVTVEEAMEAYKRDDRVAYAEPNYTYHLHETIPNDADFSKLWGQKNTGQVMKKWPTDALQTGTAGADMKLTEAWGMTTGSATVVVAVIDTGVNYLHPDLAPNIWVNTDETAGDRLDNDGNGFVDDIQGWNFSNDTNDPMDVDGHGTHVAGTIAASGNDGLGVAGAMWQARIMPLTIFNPTGNVVGATDCMDAIQYANANGAHVINNSWGGEGYSQALKDVIDASSAVVVCSAGNAGWDMAVRKNYPACYDSPNVISVAASDNQDMLSGFSNYGTLEVDVAAPGEYIWSTVLGAGYDYKDGTSMAAPQVSGLAGLVKAWSPGLTNIQIRNRILSNVDVVANLGGKVAMNGRINALKTLQNPPAAFPVESVTLDKEALTLNLKGATASLAATVLPANASINAVIYSSSNSKVASVSANGTVTPLTAGTAVITAHAVSGGLTDSCAVTVNPPLVTGVTLDITTLTLDAGAAASTLTATVAPNDAGNKSIIWSSNHPEIASVVGGMVTPLTPGTATITATTADGGFSASCAITVNAVPVTGVALDKGVLSLDLGSPAGTVTATVAPANATNKAVTYTSSVPGVATVSPAGAVTPVAEGTTVVTATTADGSFTADCNVTVHKVPVAGVTVSPASLSLTVGKAAGNLTASIQPANASVTAVTWSSSNPSVASVAGGVVTPLAGGTATITATTAEGSFSAACLVTVTVEISYSGGGGATPAPVKVQPASEKTVSTDGSVAQSVAITANTEGQAALDGPIMEKILKEAKDNKATELIIKVEAKKAGEDGINLKMPASILSSAQASGVQALTVSAGVASISIPVGSLGGITSTTKAIQLSVNQLNNATLSEDIQKKVGSQPVFDFNLYADDRKISNFAGAAPVEISVPYTLKPGETPENAVVYFINDNGQLESLPFSRYDEKTKTMVFHTNHFSKYTIMGAEGHRFEDLGNYSWANPSIRGLYGRSIIKGMDNRHFAPDQTLTRAQFIKMLMNALNLSSGETPQKFSDVPPTHWAYGQIMGAYDLKIAEAADKTTFGVDTLITREEMALMAYRAMLKKGITLKTVSGSLLLKDMDKVSDNAQQAVKALYTSGLVNGDAAGMFNPKGNLTRAEAAVITYKLYLKQ